MGYIDTYLLPDSLVPSIKVVPKCTNMKHQNLIPYKSRYTSKLKSRKRESIILKLPVVNKSDPTHFACTFCDEYFTKKHLLLRHLKLHKTVNSHISDSVAEESRENDEEHVKTVDGQETKQTYTCEHCGLSCESKSVLALHLSGLDESDKERIECKICHIEFQFKCLLSQHTKCHDRKDKRTKSLPCRICGKLYAKRGSLVKHELQHEGKGRFRCRPCGKVFTTEAERASHKEKEHEKLWKCTTCHHHFTSKSKLDSHRQLHHTKETGTFLCSLCGKGFKLKVNLKVHVESRCGTEPRHVCKICNKAFMTRGTLVTHHLLHTGEKTFLCGYCGKSFRLKVEMQRHERSHTGEKPFVCKVCNKAFAHRESLVTHTTLHTGIRPYMCEACGATFSCIGNLIKHRKTHQDKCGTDMVDRKLAQEETQPVVSNTPSEPASFLPGDYAYRTAPYENSHEWIPPIFTPSEQVLDRIPGVSELESENMDRHLKNAPSPVIFPQTMPNDEKILISSPVPNECPITTDKPLLQTDIKLGSFPNNTRIPSLKHTMVQIPPSDAVGVKSEPPPSEPVGVKLEPPPCELLLSSGDKKSECNSCEDHLSGEEDASLNESGSESDSDDLPSEDVTEIKTEEEGVDYKSSNEELKLESPKSEKQSNEKKFQCSYCSKEFDLITCLNRHEKCHVNSKEMLSCQFCDRKYANKACLAKHELQHSNSCIYRCKECNETYDTKTEYRSHRTKQHAKQWTCTICDRSFSTSTNLKNHTNSKHLGQVTTPSYVCHICGKLFKQKGNLKLHVDSRCGTDPQHICNVCGKSYMSFGSLGTHQLLHTGQKTFLCGYCGKSFRLKVEMQRHERSHTGEKPFVCTVCNKAFAHRESLVTHNTLHTGIKPYMCEACGYTFSCIGNLIKHRQTRNRRCDLARSESSAPD
ncbi:zinc finger protein 665 [Anabrus simplex]|uniref:zinc finger protein 665 n=1 Tax=Anabrus simplex TaxID=316456 RepID=UPI0035A2F20A